jgi:hypothetical protein
LIKAEREAIEDGEDGRIFVLFEIVFLNHTRTFLQGLGGIGLGLLLILVYVLMLLRS